jgi:hypothetical protein
MKEKYSYVPNHFQRKLRRLQWTDDILKVEIIPRIPLDILIAEKKMGNSNEDKVIKHFYTVEIMKPLLNYLDRNNAIVKKIASTSVVTRKLLNDFDYNKIDYQNKGRSIICKMTSNQISYLSLFDFVAGIVERRQE